MTEKKRRCRAGGPAEYIHVRAGGRAEVFCADCHEAHPDVSEEQDFRCVQVSRYLRCGDELQPAERE